MDVSAITTIISTLGFPIACCIGLFWYLTKESERHREETDKLKTAIDNNTIVITKLYERLGGKMNNNE